MPTMSFSFKDDLELCLCLQRGNPSDGPKHFVMIVSLKSSDLASLEDVSISTKLFRLRFPRKGIADSSTRNCKSIMLQELTEPQNQSKAHEFNFSVHEVKGKESGEHSPETEEVESEFQFQNMCESCDFLDPKLKNCPISMLIEKLVHGKCDCVTCTCSILKLVSFLFDPGGSPIFQKVENCLFPNHCILFESEGIGDGLDYAADCSGIVKVSSVPKWSSQLNAESTLQVSKSHSKAEYLIVDGMSGTSLKHEFGIMVKLAKLRNG